MIKHREAQSREEWDKFVDGSNGHALQTWGWGEVKTKHGWSAQRVWFERGDELIGGAQILRRKLGFFGAMLYVPRGPVVGRIEDRKDVLVGLKNWAEENGEGSVCLSLEPDWTAQSIKSNRLALKGWKKSKNRILLAKTTAVDLSENLEELLASMPKNRRQDIRKYQKSGLRLEQVETEADFEGALKVYKEISLRAKFNLHEDKYYKDIWQEMGAHQWLGVVKNEQGQVMAFQWALLSGKNGFALFAGVGDEGRRRRINAGVKWECMGILKEMGVERYDFNGLLNEGVNDYKRAFGGEDEELCGTLDLALSSKYGIYSKVLPAAKKITHFLEKMKK